jgi:hypothetical protein
MRGMGLLDLHACGEKQRQQRDRFACAVHSTRRPSLIFRSIRSVAAAERLGLAPLFHRAGLVAQFEEDVAVVFHHHAIGFTGCKRFLDPHLRIGEVAHAE